MMTSNCRSDFAPLPQMTESDRLRIRPTQRSDAPYLKKWWNDPNVTTPGGNVAGMQYDDDDIENWFKRYVDGRECHSHFIIVLRAGTTQPIGELYIASDDRPGSVGLALVIGETAQWGNGYATEALRAYSKALFTDHHCGVIRIDVSIHNENAIRMCAKAGYEVEHVWANGQFQTMSLTEEGFAAPNPPAQD